VRSPVGQKRRPAPREDPTAGLRGNAELDAAFREAESCKTLAGSGASATTPTTPASATPTS
jgi:hypothetical protein